MWLLSWGLEKRKPLKAVENPLSGWIRGQKGNYFKGLGGGQTTFLSSSDHFFKVSD
jgi:hypothetical protein